MSDGGVRGALVLLLQAAVVGGFSWALCPWVSNQFEPFDTTLGLLLGQVFMVTFVALVAWYNTLGGVLLSVVGLYFGQNAYAYVFGGDESRAWAGVLLLSSVGLCLLPLLGGCVVWGVKCFTCSEAP